MMRCYCRREYTFHNKGFVLILLWRTKVAAKSVCIYRVGWEIPTARQPRLSKLTLHIICVMFEYFLCKLYLFMPSTLFYKSKPPHAIYFTTSIFIQNQAIYFLNDDIGRAEKRKTFQVGLPCIYATCCVGSLYHWRLHSKILFIFMWY